MAQVKLISMQLSMNPNVSGGDTRDEIENVLAKYSDWELKDSHAVLINGSWALLFVLHKPITQDAETAVARSGRGRPPVNKGEDASA